MVDRDALMDRRDKLIDALHEQAQVVETFDSNEGPGAWESPTLAEATRIADFVLEFLTTDETD